MSMRRQPGRENRAGAPGKSYRGMGVPSSARSTAPPTPIRPIGPIRQMRPVDPLQLIYNQQNAVVEANAKKSPANMAGLVIF